MKFMKVGSILGAVLYAHLVTGCGSAAAPDGVPQSGSTETGPSGNGAKSSDVPESPSAPLLFEDPHVSGLRLDVYEIDSYPTVVVRGPIGVALPDLPPGATLAEIYENLHPNEAVPSSALAPLDARLAQLLEAVAPATLAPATPTAAKEASIEKSYGWWAANGCINFSYNSSYYLQVLECEYVNSYGDDLYDWDGGRTWLGQDRGYALHTYLPLQRDDRMLHFNNANLYSVLDFFTPADSFFGSGIFLGPYSWAWVRNYGPGPYGAKISPALWDQNPLHTFFDPQANFGEVGLTLHRLFRIVK